MCFPGRGANSGTVARSFEGRCKEARLLVTTLTVVRRPSFQRLWLVPVGSGSARRRVAVLTSRVADWFVMTDELFYERLALSVVRLHSPLPHVHGELCANINQLYPLCLAHGVREPATSRSGSHAAHSSTRSS